MTAPGGGEKGAVPMRLFVALWPPDDVVRHLLAGTADVRRAATALRWVDAAHLHLTVAFLGAVTPAQRSQMEPRLARVAARYAPLTLQLDGAGRFGDRVLFVRVSAPGDRLGRLAASTAAAARRCGLTVDERAFRAHVTLARGRPPAQLRPVASALAGLPARAWTATRLHLVCSTLGAGPSAGPAYETLAWWPLTGGA